MSEPYNDQIQEQIDNLRGLYRADKVDAPQVAEMLEPFGVQPQFHPNSNGDWTFVAIPIQPQFPEVTSG